ncbi:DnaA-like protein [Rhizobium sp. PP-F2F-G38]|nr:DnaA-like protein [Rhizobium sp. PP-WC-1G-195]PYE99514.1 DnaA-like protein [Rhizobium sp. PP-F2F-G38]
MTMPPAHADSALTTMGPMGLLGRFTDDLRPAVSLSPLVTRPFLIRAASYGTAAPGHEFARAPECKSVWPPSAAPAISRVSELPDTAAPDPLAQARCRMVADVVEELTMMVGDRQQLRRDRRRMMTHVRQIAMYVSHVVLQVSLTDIGVAFGRDRSTVSYSCHVVEDRRDDADFDAFVSAIERVITAVFPPAGDAAHA